MSANIKELHDTIFSGVSNEDKKKIITMTESFVLAVGLVTRLRSPNGCPWDKEQTHLSLRQYLIEEAYEVLDCLDSNPINKVSLTEELGDLLLQILLHSRLSEERGDFDMGTVCFKMAEKLVSRHPHVFGDVSAKTSDEVLQNWEALKKKEGKKNIFDGMPKNLPSLQKAARVGDKVARVGFDWKDWSGAWDKVKEETTELYNAIESQSHEKQEEELGDLFFALCNLSRHLKISPEDAHRKAISKFQNRFLKLEELAKERGIQLSSSSLDELDKLWEEIKKT